jgi:hypothetical protein
MKRPGVWISLALVSGLILGGAVTDSDSPPDIIEVPRTKIIHDPAPPPEQVEVLSESCRYTLELGDRIVRSAEAIYNSGQEQLGIFSDVRLHMAQHRSTLDLETQQRRLHGKTVDNLYDLEQSFSLYEQARQECEDE